MRRPSIVLAAVLLAASALTACGVSEEEAATSTDGTTEPATPDPGPADSAPDPMAPDLAVLQDPQDQTDVLPAAADALITSHGIDPLTSRRLEAPGSAEFYVSRGPDDGVCLVVVLGADADVACGHPLDLQMHGIYAEVATGEDELGGHLVPDSVAGSSNIVLPTDDGSDPSEQLDADAVAQTGFVLGPAVDLSDNDSVPDLARLTDTATPQDELPEDVRGSAVGIVEDSARWLGGNELRQYYVARTESGGLCFFLLLPGKTSGIGCATVGTFHAYGVWVRLSNPAGSTEAWLVPDAVAGDSNVVELGDDAPAPIDQLDADRMAETDFRFPPAMGEAGWTSDATR